MGLSHYHQYLFLLASIFAPFADPYILTFPLSTPYTFFYSYTASIPVGTPPQFLPLNVNTGATLTAASCAGCHDCIGTIFYSPAASSSSKMIQCNSSLCPYQGCNGQGNGTPCYFNTNDPVGGQVTGALYRDALGLSWDVTVGCAVINKGDSNHRHRLASPPPISSGILGLLAKANQPSQLSLLSILWNSGALDSFAFSVCFLPPSGVAGAAGALLLGDSTGGGAVGAQWVSLSTPTPFYSPYLLDAILGGNASLCAPPYLKGGQGCAAPLNTPFAAIDTSTPFTYLPSPVFQALLLGVGAWCTEKPGRCIGKAVDVPLETLCYNSPLLHTFPTLTLIMAVTPPTYNDAAGAGAGAAARGNPSPLLPPVNLTFPLFPPIIQPWSQGNTVCLAVYDNGRYGTSIGGNALVNTTLIFDVAGGRLGVSNDTAPCYATPTPPPPPSLSSSSSFSSTPSATPLSLSPSPSPGGGGSSSSTPSPMASFPSLSLSSSLAPQPIPSGPGGRGEGPPLLVAVAVSVAVSVVVGLGGGGAVLWWWWKGGRRGKGRWAGPEGAAAADSAEVWARPNPASASSISSVRGDVLSVWNTAAEGGAGSEAAAARAAALKETLLLRGGVPLPPRPEE